MRAQGRTANHAGRVIRIAALLLIAFELGGGIWTEASAIPLFGRRYNTTCNTCHTSAPLLNEFGRRFQANGYQLPGTSEQLAQMDQPIPPLALLAQPMVLHTTVVDNMANTSMSTNSLSGIEVGLFSSASLGSHFSYFAEVPVAITTGETRIEVNDAHIMYTNVLGDNLGELNFRFGKMRLFIPFIPNVIMSGADPLIYGYDPLAGKTANDLHFAEPTFGAAAYGLIPQIADGLRWDLAYTAGNKSDIDLRTAHAFFAALNQTVFVSNAPMRLGAFFYGGKQDVADSTLGPLPWSNTTTRIGADAEIYDPWTHRVDLFFQYLRATDANMDNAGTTYQMDGGFAGVNIIVLPEKLYAYGRYDYMKSKQTDDIQRQIDVGLHFNLLPNVIVSTSLQRLIETLPHAIDQATTTVGAGILFGF